MKTYRKIIGTTPGGTSKIRHVKQKPHHKVCGITGERLPGIKATKRSKARISARSSKRVNRKYGGTYSSRVSRALIRQEVRQNV